MLEIGTGVRLALAEDIMLQAIPELDHYYAFNIKSGDQFLLNHSAHWILEAMGHTTDFGTLNRDFAQAFDIEFQRAKEDLNETIQLGAYPICPLWERVMASRRTG